jgi:hypothetical protein
MVKGRTLFWWRWLLAVTAGVQLFGLSMVLAPALTRRLFSWLLFPSSDHIAGFGEPAVAYIGLAHAVMGAVMFGWGVLLLLVLLGPFKRASREGWNMVAISLAAWFIPDTAFSLWSGFWQNAVLNAALAALLVIPLVATRGACSQRAT